MRTNLHKIVAFLLVSLVGLSAFTANAANLKGGEELYLVPNSNWKKDNARFAVYFFNDTSGKNTWVSMDDCDGDGKYEVVAPEGDWEKLIFCRMKSNTSNDWVNKLAQTADLTYASNKNTYKISNNSGNGTWDNNANAFVYKILGVNKDWKWENGLTFGPHSDANNKKEVMYQCLEVKDTEVIKVVRNKGCYYGNVKAGSVAVTYDNDGNIVLSEGVYDLYFDKTTNQLYIGNATPTKAYLIGLEGSDKINMPLNSAKTEFVLTNQLVKSTDNVKVLLEWSCGVTAEYVALDGAVNCSSVKSTASGITMGDGYYDFYFKLNARVLYVEANKDNTANQKYVLMGIGKDWTTGIELESNPNNVNELMLLDQTISKANDAIKVVKKTPCADTYYGAVSASSTVPCTYDKNSNIVLEDGTYDFYFDMTTGKIRIEGEYANANSVYLDPQVYDEKNPGTWMSDNARIAVYCYQSAGTDNVWVTASYCNGDYYAQIPAAYDKYIWCRMNPAQDENRWNTGADKEYVWNQTSGITYDAENTLTKLTAWTDNDSKGHYQTKYTGLCGVKYDCEFPAIKGDTVFVHINQFVESDPCNYVFSSFEQAFAVLKSNSEICSASTVIFGSLKQDEITLLKPVVMLVHYGPEYYRGVEKVGMSGGHINDAPAIFFRNINREGGKTLIVRTADASGNRAVLVHPVIRRSRNVVLDNLDIISDKDLRDNALDIDTGEGDNNLENLQRDFNIVPLSNVDHNITLKNCFVESYGRNGIHVVGIKGIHVENNEFYTKYDFSVDQTEGEDVVDWGGTIKFINTTDVRFLRNDSEGTLATSFFIQGCQRVLLMNNVFWNDNAVSVPQLAAEGRTVANVRLVNYGTKAAEFPLKNIGIYYNTFFIKNNPSTDLADSYVKFDFFRLGGLQQPVIAANFDPNTIRFQYNNCYSYDKDIEGNNDDATKTTTFYLQGIGRSTDWCQCFSYNNFWSKYDELHDNTSSCFEIGKFCTGTDETYNLYANVSEQVCKTDPKRPGALVVKGDAMNIGTMIEEDASLQGADQLFNDRLNPDNSENCVRPRMSVDNSNDALSPYDDIYIEPGTINLFTSPIVGSQTTDVMVTSIKLTPKSDVNLSIVDKNDDPIADGRFAITNAEGTPIAALTTDSNGSLENEPVYVTFVRPEIDEDRTYEAFLMIVPSQAVDKQLILRIPLRGHHKAALTSIPGAWTVGAFQQRVATPVDTIIWHGSHSAAWDDRNNWYKTDGSLVTCLDALTEDLTVIIPKKDSEKYVTPPAGITNYPTLPKIASDYDFNDVRKEKWSGEQVNAGSTAKVANKIVMEYGASLVGAEELNDDNERYNEAEVEFIARRNTWLLAGAVVRPWKTDENGKFVVEDGKKQTRLACSRDYYRWHLPQVYMHEAIIDPATNKATWGVEFPDLDIDLPKDRAYAIHIPNEYGYYYDPASTYNYINGTNYDPEEPIRYTFTGRFYNEDQLPTYSVVPKTTVILTNTYPANIDAVKLHESGRGTVQVYSYDDQSFNTVEDATKTAVIQAQHSFVFTPNETLKQLNIEREWLLNTEVTHRSAETEMPFVRIEMRNGAKKVASNVYIAHDQAKADVADWSVDAPKVFNGMNRSLPDLYVMRYNGKWAGVHIPTVDQPIPLGVNVSQKNQTFTFGLVSTNIVGQILLEDRLTETVTDLSTQTYSVSDLAVGACEGRFYLSIVPSPDQEFVPDDLPTNVDDTEADAHQISIYARHNNVTISTNLCNNLQTIIVSDMVGRHQVYKVSGRYVTLSLPVVTGIYTIHVVADNAVRTEKIYLSK